MEAALSELETTLGHGFAARGLLVHALTHRSLAHQLAVGETPAGDARAAGHGGEETGSPAGPGTLAGPGTPAGPGTLAERGSRDDGPAEKGDNERLEFLGDAVLGLVVAEALFSAHPEWHEGELTRVRSQLVSRKHLAEVAVAVDLGKYLRLSRGEERGGLRTKTTVLSNSMEAVIGAMFLDGGLEPVQAFARRHVMAEAAEQLAQELRDGAALGNFKSALQEYFQQARAGMPEYRLKAESGPDHRKHFLVEVRLRRAPGAAAKTLARGKGTTKKLAEQDAARQTLEMLKAGELRIGGEAEAMAAEGRLGE